MNFCCFKSLSFWKFVTVAIGNYEGLKVRNLEIRERRQFHIPTTDLTLLNIVLWLWSLVISCMKKVCKIGFGVRNTVVNTIVNSWGSTTPTKQSSNSSNLWIWSLGGNSESTQKLILKHKEIWNHSLWCSLHSCKFFYERLWFSSYVSRFLEVLELY